MTIDASRGRTRGRAVVAVAAVVMAAVLLAGACAAPARPAQPASEHSRSELIKTAQQVLVDRCLHARGAAGPPPRQEVLFGSDPAELSVTLATGYTVRAHTDGCLAEADRFLYGDLGVWFHAEVTVNNLRPEAQARLAEDADYRAALARRAACADDDAVCIRDSGLEQARARLEPARIAEVRAERRDAIDTYNRLRDRAAHQAAGLLADLPTPRTKGNASS